MGDGARTNLRNEKVYELKTVTPQSEATPRQKHAGGRPVGSQNKIVAYVKGKSVGFFQRLLSDENEEKFWWYFMTGYVVDVLPDGTKNIIKIPIEATSWNAFKRAVEYKRGMPIQPVEHSGTVMHVLSDAEKREASEAIKRLVVFDGETGEEINA
jgi:hypothetical protein